MILRSTAVRAFLLLVASPAMLGSVGPRSNFDERILAAHNRERDALSSPPLEWDEQLAAGAKEWADELSRSGRFEHSPSEPHEAPEGENIWGGTPGHYLPETMVALWIEEKQHYVEGIFPLNSRTGRVEDVSHYTQLIWRRTGRVGCALSSEGDEEILVCRYSSAGNVEGQKVT